jgi:ligand-binding sensor domain-containing protein
MSADRPVLLRYRGARFESVGFATNPREVAATAMTLDQSGNLLVYAQVSGLLAWRGQQFEPRPLGTVPRSIVLAMAVTPDGTLFLGTREAGLFVVRDGRASAVSGRLPDLKVNCLLATSNREVWIGTDRGVARWNGAEVQTEGLPPELAGVQALALQRDRDGNVWIGTSAGLLRVNAHGVAELPGRGGPTAAVTAIFEDREGDLWVGDGSGIERLHETVFASWTRTQGLPIDAGGAIHVDRDHRVWFAAA